MSYQVYITRAEFWAENEGADIPAGEWLELIQNDADLARDQANGPYFAALNGSDANGDSWLDWFEGNVYTSYPNRALQRKILQIAGQLGAVVQGDDGELYASEDDFPEAIERRRPVTTATERLPAYERREILWQVVIYGTIAAAIIAVNVFDLW